VDSVGTCWYISTLIVSPAYFCKGDELAEVELPLLPHPLASVSVRIASPAIARTRHLDLVIMLSLLGMKRIGDRHWQAANE